MKIQINQNLNGIIVIDVLLRTNPLVTTDSTVHLEIPTHVEKMDFEFINDQATIKDIGTTTLTPTVKTNVKTLEFDHENNAVRVYNSSGTKVYEASSKGTTVLARVNFATSTITIYE